MRIFVLTDGWVLYGEIVNEEKNTIKIKNAGYIREWGTTKGLGELKNGFLENTVLDPLPKTTIFTNKIIYSFKISNVKK